MFEFDRLPAALGRLSRVAVTPECTDEEALERQTLTLVALTVAILAALWSISYLALARPLSASIPGAYTIVVLLTVAWVARTKNYGAFKAGQIALLLPLPFFLQWSLGGFAQSGAVSVWSFIAAVMAIAFGFRHWLMFGIFLALIGVSVVVDPIVAAAVPPLDPTIELAFFAANLAGTSITVFLGLVWFTAERRRLQAEVIAAQRRSDELLLNILPAPIADRLKAGERTIADRVPAVSVLFVDMVDFTRMSQDTPVEEIIDSLDAIFSAMDGIAEDLGLEKLKTMGDGYQAIAGAPIPLDDHAGATAEAALRIMETVRGMPFGSHRIELRIGLDTGPVIAAVVGRSKFAYDVWGEAVNLASRMESQGVPGRIQVTGRFRDAVVGPYRFEPRASIDVKSFGPSSTFFLERA
jgi:adenylate cyclase